jgi:trehalose-6-phosphatase
MDMATRKANHAKLYRYVTKYTAAFWGGSFVKELKRVTSDSVSKQVPRLTSSFLLEKFKLSKKKRVFLLDYDGTLTTIHQIPEFAKPSAHLLDMLKRLCNLPNVYVYILSGRPRAFLEKWFGDIGVGFCAEHGCFYKHPRKFYVTESSQAPSGIPMTKIGIDDHSHLGVLPIHGSASSTSSMEHLNVENGWVSLVDVGDTTWRATIEPLFQHYYERTPGSFIETKEINLTWHYRNADPEFGQWQATELQINLEKIVAHVPVSVSISLHRLFMATKRWN